MADNKFIPFEEFQRAENENYYKKKGIELYEDFSTAVSACNKLAMANAREFYQFLTVNKINSNINTCEVGIGNGNFTYFFIKELERLDKVNNTDFFGKVNFILVDFSEKILANVESGFKHFDNIELVRCNAEMIKLKKKVLYLRANELLSDLPSLLLVRNGRNIKKVFIRRLKTGVKIRLEKIDIKDQEISKMLEVLPEDYIIPFNLKAFEFIRKCREFMDWKKGAYIDIFDYGFNDLGQIFYSPKEVWNAMVFREYGEQITVDLNFPFISRLLSKSSLKSRIETQLEYMERTLKERLYQALLDINEREEIFYLTKQELKKYSKDLVKKGYSEEFLNGEIREEFSFYHYRISV